MANKALKFTVAALLTLAAGTTATLSGLAGSQKFYPDDPVWVEEATQDAASVKPVDLNLFVDLTYNILKGTTVPSGARAKNLNTVDEVPNSSWYTNRLGTVALT